VESSLRQMDASLEDAARGLGASWWLTMRRVVLPAARPGLIAGALLAAVTAVGEFVASVVLYTHANRPISLEILAQLRAFAFGTAASYSVLLILLVLLMTLAARSFEERIALPMKRPRIVIIGGGFGGLSAAKALRSAAADVLVIDRTNHHLFQPLL